MSLTLLDAGGRGEQRSPSPTADADRALRLDRERIARDLHDHVIQRLFAAGLATQRVARGLGDGGSSSALERVVAELDDAMREIRATVFDLAGPLGPERGLVRARLRSVAAGLADVLGFEPTMHFHGRVDELPEALVPDLVAVVREGLVNVARHAHAGRADIMVVVTVDAVLLRLRDDGIGVGEAATSSGLANLHTRAQQRNGSVRLLPGSSEPPLPRTSVGTCLLWSAPLL